MRAASTLWHDRDWRRGDRATRAFGGLAVAPRSQAPAWECNAHKAPLVSQEKV